MDEMDITSVKYNTSDNTSITAVIEGKILSIPLDPANRHYAAIQEWVAEGNTIQEAEE